MPSDFLLQIVERSSGKVLKGFEPGSQIETDLVDELLVRAHGYGVGALKTSAAVDIIIRKSWAELLYSLKSQVSPHRPQ